MKKILVVIVGALLLVLALSTLTMYYYCSKKTPMPKKADPLLKYCRLRGNMDLKGFNDFMAHLSKERQLVVLQACVEDISQYKNRDRISIDKEIKKGLVWTSSHKVFYPFKDKENIKYDKIVRWVAKELKIDGSETKSTLRLERMILSKMFEQSWDKMTPEQREAALKQMDGASKIDNIAGISLLSGSAALATLSTTVAFSGFAFYTGLSSFLYSAASVLGVTLPFAAYTGSAATFAALSGPIGWTLIGIGTALGVYFIGQPDYQKTARIIIAIHMIKVEAIKNSGLDINEYVGTQPRRE